MADDFESKIKGFYSPVYQEEPKQEYKKLPTTNPRIKKLKEQLKVEEYKQEVKENPLLNRNGVIILNKNSHSFWIFFAMALFVIFLIFSYFLFFTDKLDPYLIKIRPSFNATINNNVTINPTFNNPVSVDNRQGDTNIYLNATINAPNLVCNSS